ncbi:hypothetical protein TELCIR_18481, partial [Teladorsagia circumcincta]
MGGLVVLNAHDLGCHPRAAFRPDRMCGKNWSAIGKKQEKLSRRLRASFSFLVEEFKATCLLSSPEKPK